MTGKSSVYVRNLQNQLGLPVMERGSYTYAYLAFVQRVIFLRAFSVPLQEISELFAREKQLLCMLKMDALASSRTWYLDQCGLAENTDSRLMLTGHNVGFPVQAGTIQTNLDFGRRDKELFESREMGEDVKLSLDAYLKAASKVKARIARERMLLRRALSWARSLTASRPVAKEAN